MWVLNDGGRWPGCEHTYAQHGLTRLVAWSQKGLAQYRWVSADKVTERDPDAS